MCVTIIANISVLNKIRNIGVKNVVISDAACSMYGREWGNHILTHSLYYYRKDFYPSTISNTLSMAALIPSGFLPPACAKCA